MVAVVLGVAAVVAAAVLRRRRPDGPPVRRWAVPAQLDRADLGVDAPWVAVVFTAATCGSCAAALTATREAFAGAGVPVVEVEAGRRADLHRRYGIEAVPTVVVADPEGVVRVSHLGVPSPSALLERFEAVRAGGPPSADGTPGDPAG